MRKTGGGLNDTITGGKGADVMKGGVGVNTFVFNSGDGVKATSVVTTAGTTVFTFGNGVDIISDFKSVGNRSAAAYHKVVDNTYTVPTTAITNASEATTADTADAAYADTLIYNGTTIVGTATAFLAMADAGSAAGTTNASTSGLNYIVGTWDNSAKTFTEGAGIDFIMFNNADTTALTDVKLTGISDIMVHDYS